MDDEPDQETFDEIKKLETRLAILKSKTKAKGPGPGVVTLTKAMTSGGCKVAVGPGWRDGVGSRASDAEVLHKRRVPDLQEPNLSCWPVALWCRRQAIAEALVLCEWQARPLQCLQPIPRAPTDPPAGQAGEPRH